MTREKARDVLEDYGRYESFGDKNYHDAFIVAVKALEQPEQKKGKWIVAGFFDSFLKCSCCGYMKPWNEDIFKFCPHCGAKMEEEK